MSPGTTVEWHWVEGLANNVVSLDGTFHSGEPTDDPEVTFGHTFEAPGTHRYVSEPHRECGMRGVVSVEEAPTSDYPEVDRWLLPADNYDGTVTDETGAATTTVVVGAEGADGHHFAFEPPALKVSPGATVRWVWTGEGGAHDVAFRDGDVQSADITAEAGATHEHTFESTGIYRYACRPHEGIGQRGAIVVE